MEQRQQAPQAPEDQAALSKRPVVLPETFNGEGDWNDWQEHFESVAAVNRWQEQDKLLWLRVRLVGRAATAFKSIDDGAKGSYPDCVAALKERFDPGSKRELYLVELLARKRRQKEDWASFAEDLKRLVERAYPELQDNAREQIALTHYLGQLVQPQLAFGVKQRRPKSVDEAVRTTLEMESYLSVSTPKLAVASPMEDQHLVDIPSGVAAVGKKQQGQPSTIAMLEQILDRIDNLEARMDQLAKEVASDTPSSLERKPANKANTSQTSRGPVTCHRCGKTGHFAKGCATPRSQSHAKSGNDKPSM